MKKTLALFSFIFCLSFAVRAQSTDAATQSAGGVNTKTAVAEPTSTVSTGSGESSSKVSCTPSASKSCCSSKNGKETASGESKSCCANGKKSDSHCSDKKAMISPEQQNKTDQKSNTQ